MYKTQAELAEMTTLDKLKYQTTEYLTDEQNDQIRGFYEWDGYWTRKDEATRPSCLNKNGLQERLDNLPALFDYMSSITPEMIRDWTRADGRNWLNKYGTVIMRVVDGSKPKAGQVITRSQR